MSAKGQNSIIARRKSVPLWNLLQGHIVSPGCPVCKVSKGTWQCLLLGITFASESVATSGLPICGRK